MKKIYFLTILFLCLSVKAQQTPGGITNVQMEYWLKANELMPVLPQDGADVVQWNDLSGNSRNFVNLESNPFYPKFIKSAMNFNSSVDFYNNLDTDDGGTTAVNNRRRKLMSVNDFTADATKSYFVVWVSKLDPDLSLSSSNAAVFGLNASSTSGNTNGNQFGWRTTSSTARLWNRTRGTEYLQTPIPSKHFGIAIAVLPNDTSTPQEIYLDALKSTASMSGRILGVNSGRSVLGTTATDTGYENYFFGEVMEVIVLSRDGIGNTLSQNELNQLNSYLAIKYGITLNHDTQSQYVLSDGSIIYDVLDSDYVGYDKDIFGIARDNASGLYQKQAMSTDNPVLAVFVDELKESNAENTGSFPDKTALVFGSNALSGSSEYSKPSGTIYLNHTLESHVDPITNVVTEDKLSSIFNTKLKAKISGATSITVNVSPSMGEWLLIGQDSSFDPANTRIYKIVNGQVNNLVINDGDYLGFAYFLKAPAGVTSGLAMWLNASKRSTLTLNSNGEVTNWVDFSGFGTAFSQINAGTTAPLYVEIDEDLNFHPGVYFRKTLEYLSTRKGPFSVAAPDDYSFFTALNARFNTSSRIYFTAYGALTRSLYPALGVREGNPITSGRARIYDGGGAGSIDGNSNLFQSNATTIIGHTMKKNTYFEFYADAYKEYFGESAAGRGSRLNGPGTLGIGGSSNSRNMIGVMGEHIAYEGAISNADRDKIDSYLGLKYAITVDKDKANKLINFDFVLSDGTTIVWPGQSNPIYHDYHNNVASVVRDDNSDLHNRQSKSTDIGSIIHMGIGRKLGLTPDLDDIQNNYSGLTWGHNNLSVADFSVAGDPTICGAIDTRLNGRVWLVDNTNFTQEVILVADGENFPYAGSNYQVYLLVADSPEKLAANANNWDQMIPMTFVDGKHQINYKFTKKRTYFTFGAKQVGFCEGCEFSGIKSFDFTRANWPRGQKGPATFNLGDDFNLKIEVLDPSNVLRPRYPRNSSLGSLREYRRGVGEVTTKISFQNGAGVKKSASTSFELFDIDRVGNAVDNAQVIGYCNGSPVYPKMYYEYNRPDRSRYTIQNQGRAIAKSRGVRYNGNSGYTSLRGRVFVEFEYPVDEIRIVYTTPNSGSSSNYIGVGSMEFYCPAPLPAPNEDGLILTKQGPNEVKLCDVVDYTFRVVNTNCAEKPVKLSDLLPEGMTWVNDSFNSGGQSYSDVAGYGTRDLIINDLVVPGGGSTYTFRASAIFDQNATAKVYENRAKLEYESLGLDKEIESIDRLTGESFTLTNALASSRLLPVTTQFTSTKACFNLNSEIEVTLQVTNPNASSFSDMFLITDYNSEVFEFIPNSLETSTGLNLTPDFSEEGAIFFEDFNLPTGTSWIKFKVRASDDLNDYEIDPSTNNPIEVDFNFELFSEADQECLESVFANANGTIEMQFCTVCYYAPITVGNAANILNSEGFAAITSLNRNNSEWITLRGNAFLVLESQNKGFVVTRLTTAQINQMVPVEGMLVYDTTINCLKMYNGTSWGCLEQGCVDE